MIAPAIEWLVISGVRPLVSVEGACQACPSTSVQRIYVANHSSHMDAVRLLAALPAEVRRRTRPVAAEDYWTIGPLRRYLVHSVFRSVLLERNRVQLNPLEPVANALRQGDSLILFPEGTRGSGDALQPLKPGIFYLARWFPDIDIVPAWIDPHTVLASVRFGTPLRWTPGQNETDFLAEVRQALERLRPRGQ